MTTDKKEDKDPDRSEADSPLVSVDGLMGAITSEFAKELGCEADELLTSAPGEDTNLDNWEEQTALLHDDYGGYGDLDGWHVISGEMSPANRSAFPMSIPLNSATLDELLAGQDAEEHFGVRKVKSVTLRELVDCWNRNNPERKLFRVEPPSGEPGDWTARALLREALAERAKGRPESAQEFLGDVLRLYPESTEAGRAREMIREFAGAWEESQDEESSNSDEEREE